MATEADRLADEIFHTGVGRLTAPEPKDPPMAREVEELKASDLDALERIAGAATPGPWEHDPEWVHYEGMLRPSMNVHSRAASPDSRFICNADVWKYEPAGKHENAEHIATFDPPTIFALIALARRSLPSPEAGENPHHWTPNQSTGGNWRCTKCGLATMEIASSATPERCSVIVASPAAPEAGGAETLVQYDDPKRLHFQVGDRPVVHQLVDGAKNAELLVDMETREPVGMVVYQSPAPEAGGVIAEARACTAITWPVLQRHIDKLADLAERQASDLSTKDAENARLRGIAETLVAELVTLCRAWMYAPFPAEAQICGAMSPPSGPLAVAADAVKATRAALSTSNNGAGG